MLSALNVSSPLLLGVGAGIVLVLVIVGWWERSIDRAESAAARVGLGEARERGTHKALNQFPQINPFLCIGCGSCVRACPEDDVIGLVGGVARVLHGARCIGHSLCETACPVGAIQVGLGDVSGRVDLPRLTAEGETTVPGVFIAGELGGLALIRNAIDQGARAVEAIARRAAQSPSPGGDVMDLLIVGAGPAGLSAALKAKELGLTYLVIDQDEIGGTISKYPRRKMTLIQTVAIPLHGRMPAGEYQKEDLIRLWAELVQKHAVPLRTKTPLLALERKPDHWAASTPAGVALTRFVLLALGRRGTPRKLGVPGEDAAKVLYQLVDANSYEKQHLLVVGGGDSAVEAAMALANQGGNTVTLSYRRDGFVRLKKRNEDRIQEYVRSGRLKALLPSEVTSIGPDRVELAVGPDGNRKPLVLPNHFVFVFAGGEPPFPLLKQFGVAFGVEKKFHALAGE